MVVVDASVVNKLFLSNEQGHLKVQSIFEKHIQKLEEITVPDLLFYEVANTLATKTAIPLTLIVKSLNELGAYKLKVFYPSSKHFAQAAKLSKEYKVSVYDSIYAVLAKEKKCSLITADEKFVNSIKLPFVKNLKDY